MNKRTPTVNHLLILTIYTRGLFLFLITAQHWKLLIVQQQKEIGTNLSCLVKEHTIEDCEAWLAERRKFQAGHHLIHIFCDNFCHCGILQGKICTSHFQRSPHSTQHAPCCDASSSSAHMLIPGLLDWNCTWYP